MAYFLATTEKVRNLIESDDSLLYTSVITLHEVKRKLLKMSYTPQQAEKTIQFIKENSVIIQVDDTIALESVRHCMKEKLHTIDAVIYETALQNKCTLMTADYDFKNLKNVEIVV
jgi:predicted nucleic acid-binding protein